MSDEIDDKDVEKKEPLPDMAQAEQISFYSDAPISGPASFQEAAQSKANFAQRLPGTSEWTIGNGVGALSQLTREELAEKQKQDSEEWFEEFSEVVDRVRMEEREREEWAQAKHKYAGIEMTGEEWGEFAEQLKGDTPLRKWLLEKLKKEGKTDGKATEMVDQMALLAKMQNLPSNQWTDEMKALNTKLEANPALRRELDRDLSEGKKAQGGLQLSPATEQRTSGIEKMETEVSIVNGADALAGSSGAIIQTKAQSFASTIDGAAITSTLDLTEHHKAALAAKEPLDVPRQIAAVTPLPTPTSPGGGFDS